MRTVITCLVLLNVFLPFLYGQNSNLFSSAEFGDTKVWVDNSIKVGEAMRIPYQNAWLHHVESHMVINPSNPDHWLVTTMVITDPVSWNIEAAIWRTEDGGKSWSGGYRVQGPHDHPFLISRGTETFWWSTMRGNRQLNIKKAQKGEIFQDLKTIRFNDSFRHDNMIPALLGEETLILPFTKYQSSRTGIEVEGAYFFTTIDGTNIQGPQKITDRAGPAKGLSSMLADNTTSEYRGNLYFLYTLGAFRKSEGLGLSISGDARSGTYQLYTANVRVD